MDGGHTPTAGNNVNWTAFDLSWSVPVGITIVAISVHSSAANSGFIKLADRTSAGTLNILLDQAFTHAGGGWQRFALSSAYIVPAGSIYAGAYAPATSISSVAGTNNAARRTSNQTIGSSSGWTEGGDSTQKTPLVRIHFIV